MSDERAVIEAKPRTLRGSRNARRERREGLVPGVLYGLAKEPRTFTVVEREFRAAVKAGHALMDVQLDGEKLPVMVKDTQHHPVRGGFTHIDLLVVDLDIKVHAVVAVELTGVDEAPGVVQGGVLDHVTRELNVETLPTDIPDSISIDVSSLELNSTLTLADVQSQIASNLTLLDDAEETTIVTITPPSRTEAPESVEEETEVVGEAAETQAAEEAEAAEE